jgi:mRNA interferase RelE/StbE
LDVQVRERIVSAVERYAVTGQGDVKRLRGSEDFRLRVGDWRVRFVIEAGQARVMLVLRVRHRREAYRD